MSSDAHISNGHVAHAGDQSSDRDLRIALACPGIGRAQRGYERMFSDLFRTLRGRADITLFKGGGEPAQDEHVLRFLARNSTSVRLMPVHKLVGRRPAHTEALTFALALLPRVRKGQFDVVHCIDPSLTRLLYRLRDKWNLPFRIVYTEGTAMPPSDYPPCDLLHHIGSQAYEDARAAGIAQDRMVLIPPGIDIARFSSTESRDALRDRYGVGKDTFVILCVAAINRTHKRLDHLISECEGLEGDILVWMDGSSDHGDPTLVGYGQQRLGDRCRFTQVASDRVVDLYRLADVVVLPSVLEAFGLVLAEALVCGAPVLMHDAPHFRWLADNGACHVDMRRPAALRDRLRELIEHPEGLAALTGASGARERFAWSSLADDYLAMYAQAAAMPMDHAVCAPAADGSPGDARDRADGAMADLEPVSPAVARRSTWRPHAIALLRNSGTLRLADHVRYRYEGLRTRASNRRFLREHPEFAPPPAHIAFDAINSVEWKMYWLTGILHAEMFASIIDSRAPDGALRVLEWGCGPGRLIRHMGASLPGRAVSLTGSDYNVESIAWCRGNLPGIEFVKNALEPPLAFADESFDAVYCFSVFTHLSVDLQLAWAAECRRVLRPEGLFVCTCHGDRCRQAITSYEGRTLYNTGQPVVQDGYREGRKWFLAFHPPRYIREDLLGGYADVQLHTVDIPGLRQDVWSARKPA